MEKIKVQITWLDNYGAYSEFVPGCVATNDTFEGIKEAYKEALEFHLKGMKEDGDDIPEMLQEEFELEFVSKEIPDEQELEGGLYSDNQVGEE